VWWRIEYRFPYGREGEPEIWKPSPWLPYTRSYTDKSRAQEVLRELQEGARVTEYRLTHSVRGQYIETLLDGPE
jgi:hypothetical protein